uniref:60S ribosome subunit biogenesis protein NIP7 homolog n=1 Tax=Timema tahoe TaxID=61484 RepID=A0A7R9P072_9NEOP|nr:unnamed protein product [Timema tahoe]
MQPRAVRRSFQRQQRLIFSAGGHDNVKPEPAPIGVTLRQPRNDADAMIRQMVIGRGQPVGGSCGPNLAGSVASGAMYTSVPHTRGRGVGPVKKLQVENVTSIAVGRGRAVRLSKGHPGWPLGLEVPGSIPGDIIDGTYCFRQKKERVYYISEKNLQLALTIAPEHLVSFGTCFGKFTKTGKFRLHITALSYLAPYAQYKIWLKPSAEQQFLYGHHILKSGLGRITENTPKYHGVIVLSMNDLPLGFGVAAKTTAECKHADPMSIVSFHQADIGEYIRSEDTLI